MSRPMIAYNPVETRLGAARPAAPAPVLLSEMQIVQRIAFACFSEHWLSGNKAHHVGWYARIERLVSGGYVYRLYLGRGATTWAYAFQGPFPSEAIALEAAKAHMQWIRDGGQAW